MDAKDAQKLRRACFGKPCDHPQIENGGEQGGEVYVCQTCGSEFVSREAWEKIHRFLNKGAV